MEFGVLSTPCSSYSHIYNGKEPPVFVMQAFTAKTIHTACVVWGHSWIMPCFCFSFACICFIFLCLFFMNFTRICPDLSLIQSHCSCTKEVNMVKLSLPMCSTFGGNIYIYTYMYYQQYMAVGYDFQRRIRYDSCILNGSFQLAFGSTVLILLINDHQQQNCWIKKGQISI